MLTFILLLEAQPPASCKTFWARHTACGLDTLELAVLSFREEDRRLAAVAAGDEEGNEASETGWLEDAICDSMLLGIAYGPAPGV